MPACMLEQLQARRTLTHSTAHTILTGHNKLMGYINIEGSGKNVALDKREKLSLAFEHLPGMQVTRKIGQARVANRFHMQLSAQREIFRGNQEMKSSSWKDISDLVIITRIPIPVKNSTAVASWHSFSKPLPRNKYQFDSWCINPFPCKQISKYEVFLLSFAPHAKKSFWSMLEDYDSMWSSWKKVVDPWIKDESGWSFHQKSVPANYRHRHDAQLWVNTNSFPRGLSFSYKRECPSSKLIKVSALTWKQMFTHNSKRTFLAI